VPALAGVDFEAELDQPAGHVCLFQQIHVNVSAHGPPQSVQEERMSKARELEVFDKLV
jgi:hypothetical protein